MWRKRRIADKITSQINMIIMFVSSVTFILLNSFSTSPLYSSNGWDSAVFQTIGRYWTFTGNSSLIPYRDMFDHKGPIIYVVNALGYHISGDKSGIVIIQIISLFLFCVGLYYIAKMEFSKQRSLFLVFIGLFYLAACYEGGNFTEEYALPFLVFSFYNIYRYIRSNNTAGIHNIECIRKYTDHQPALAILYGITFGVCLMTRLTNALPICIGITVITIILILGQKWLNLIQNIIGFLMGFFLIVIPFTIYFGLHNAMYDFWFGTIFYNMEYAKANEWIWQVELSTLQILVYTVFIMFISLPITIVGIAGILKKEFVSGVFESITGLMTILFLLSNHTYRHYSIVFIPYFMVTICEINKLFFTKIKKYLLALFCTVTICSGIVLTSYTFLLLIEKSPGNTNYEEILSGIPISERNNIIGYNVSPCMYLEFDIIPYYPYFHQQDWLSEQSPNITEKIIQTFRSGDVKWIIVEGNDVGIQDVLDKRYSMNRSCVNEKGIIDKLYSLK